MTTWVFCEELDGAASASALELLTKARTWGDVEVFYVGAGNDAAYATLGDHGAAKVHQLDVGDQLPAAAAAAAMAELVGDTDIALPKAVSCTRAKWRVNAVTSVFLPCQRSLFNQSDCRT